MNSYWFNMQNSWTNNLVGGWDSPAGNLSVNDGTGALLGEPLLGLIGGDSLELSEFTLGVLSSGDSLTSSCEDDEEVHTENTSVGIVLNSEIDMFIDTETEVAYKLLKALNI